MSVTSSCPATPPPLPQSSANPAPIKPAPSPKKTHRRVAPISAGPTPSHIKEGLLCLCSQPQHGPKGTFWVYGQSSSTSLQTASSLDSLRVSLDIGHPKNANKNSSAEKAIQELREQTVNASPHNGPISQTTLARVTENLNNLTCPIGSSSKES